jgi:glycosyltransferase involved in cell wall biosynthesis
MHVLISAISRFTSPTGICRHAANLAACLAARPEVEQITFVEGTWQGYYRDLLGDKNPKVKVIAVELRNSSVARNRWFLFALPQLAKSVGAEIVHLSFPVPIVPGDATYKTVVTLHDLYPYDCPEVFGFPNVYFNRLSLKNCLKNVDGISCVSDSTRSRLQAVFSNRESEKARVILNVVRDILQAEMKPNGWTDAPYILVVAQHRPNKNLELAIRGFVELRSQNAVPSACRLVIVGTTGPSTESIRRDVARLGVEREVLFLSSVPENELQWLYSHCLLFLATSTEEGFCLPLVEALRSSARVVCSDIPVLREVGGEKCEYFSLAESSSGLVRAASKALSSNGSRSPCLERFSSVHAGAAYIRFYEDLLTGARVPLVA